MDRTHTFLESQYLRKEELSDYEINDKDDDFTIENRSDNLNGECGNHGETKPAGKFVYSIARKKHNNSRNGCLNCKKRKVKCDETVPICGFCRRRDIACSFETMTPFQIHRIQETHKHSRRKETYSESRYDNQHQITSEVKMDLNNTNYQVCKMEGILLPPSLSEGRYTVPETPPNERTNLHLDYNAEPSPYKGSTNIPLSSKAKPSRRIFVVDNRKILDHLDRYETKSMMIMVCLRNRDFQRLGIILKGLKIDSTLSVDFIQTLNISQIFNKLMRKSFLLMAMDYYKNVLLVQNILSNVKHHAKLAIARVCEDHSVIFIDGITKIIKDEYLPSFNEFSVAAVNLFLGAFMILNQCTGFHFKNGSKYELGYEDGNKAVRLVAIFVTGMYAIIMEHTREELLLSGTNILSAHLIRHFKKLVIKNYDIEILDDFKKMVDKISPKGRNNINYENLKIFCEKHCKLLRANVHKHSLLGFNNGYLIRILNSFLANLPSDMCNLSPEYADKLKGRDMEIIVNISYYALGNILNSIIPGENIATANSFANSSWEMFRFDDIESLMKVFQMIESRELQLIAIYLIRTASFCKYQRIYHENYLAKYSMDSLLDENTELSIDQRYLRLRQLKEEGILKEIPVKSFLLNKGQFIKKWNYPNPGDLKPTRNRKVAENKIMNHFGGNLTALINDFIETNNGFFSLDYDCMKDLAGDNAVAKEAAFIDGFEMKMLWRLATYIRENNL